MHLIITFSILLCVSTLALGGGMFDNMGSSMMGALGKMASGAGGNPMEMAQKMMGMVQGGDMSQIQNQFQSMMEAAQKMPEAAGEESQKVIAEAQEKFEELVKNGAPPEEMQAVLQGMMQQMQSMQG